METIEMYKEVIETYKENTQKLLDVLYDLTEFVLDEFGCDAMPVESALELLKKYEIDIEV